MKVVVISGATATGKTDLAVELAKKFDGEVVNFDSLLLYKEILIGTAKPTPEEQKSIKHWMIDVSSISNPLNAADYASMARPIIDKLLAEKKNVYLVGGSGFYLQALLKGMYDSPTTPQEVTDRSDELYKKEGIQPFLEILKAHDEESFKRYHENDHYRVRRAVEHFWSHGTPLSQVRSQKDQSDEKVHDWDVLHIYLTIPREEHNKIIERRTSKMLEIGLLEEVNGLIAQGFSGQEKPLQSIGYKEVIDYKNGIFKTMEECKERIIISTRQLAKSQRTWFNRDQSKESYHPLDQRSEIFNRVESFLKS